MKTQSPETVQGRQPVWSRGRRRGVFAGGGGGHPSPAPAGLLPPPSSSGDDGTIRESHGFLRGRLGGGRAESTEAGTLRDAHDSALGKGALQLHLLPTPHPGARLCGWILVRDNCLLALHLLLPQGCSPPKFWQRGQGYYGNSLPRCPPFQPRARQQLPLPERKAGLLGSRQEPVLTSRAEGTPGKG